MAASSCGHVVIKNSQWCGAIPNAGGAVCFDTLDSDEENMSEVAFLTWLMDPTDPKVCTETSVFADQKGDLEALCHENPGICDYQTQQSIAAFKARVQMLRIMQGSRP